MDHIGFRNIGCRKKYSKNAIKAKKILENVICFEEYFII